MIFLFVIGVALWWAGRRMARHPDVIVIFAEKPDDLASESVDTFPQEWA